MTTDSFDALLNGATYECRRVRVAEPPTLAKLLSDAVHAMRQAERLVAIPDHDDAGMLPGVNPRVYAAIVAAVQAVEHADTVETSERVKTDMAAGK